MTAGWVLLAAVFCQLVAAGLALRLVLVTGRKWAWGLVALAIGMMVLRRCVPLYHLLSGDPDFKVDLVYEWLGLAISVAMMSGIALTSPLFFALRSSAEVLRDHQRKIEHLNAVLRSIRNINQLITRQTDRRQLLEGVCQCLIETRGFQHAWAMLSEGGRLTAFAGAGLEGEAAALRVRLEKPGGVPCAQRVLERPGVAVLDGSSPQCNGCPLCNRCRGGAMMAARIAYGKQVFGLLSAALPEGFPAANEEQELFLEAAGDIGFALYGIELEENRLQTEINLRLDESRLETLLRLNQMTDASTREITDFVLEEAVRLTESRIGYLAFLNEDESVLTMHSWSKTAMAQCAIQDKPIVYPVVNTGLWGEAVRQRKPVITNDYAAPNPLKKGHPEGHVPVTRHFNAPIFDGPRIVVVAGVGNKETPYDEADVRQLTLLMQGMWQLLQRRKAREQLLLEQSRLEALLRLSRMGNAPLREITDFVLEEAVRLTESRIGYLAFLNEDESVLTMHSWSKTAMAQCAIQDKPLVYPVASTGLWGEAVRQRKPVITNDYAAPNPLKKGHPEGHVPVTRHFNVPIFDGPRIVAVAGMGNKDEPYNEADVRQLTLLMEGMWRLLQRREAAELLRRANDELEERVAARTADLARSNTELERARDAAQAASRAKSTFLANMSHEIRTPLNAIIGMTDLVLKGQLSQQQREFLNTVRDSGEALLTVINDILDFSKIEAGKLTLEHGPFNFWESLGDTMKSFAIRAHQQGLELACYIHPEVPHMLAGDYSRVRQIIVNLVGNAIKFTDEGEVVVEVVKESAGVDDVVLHFTVSDTGIGIPENKQRTIFEMFEQADASMTRRHGGTGLGLAIAARLVEMMRGRLWVESQVGQGSRFHFTAQFDLAEPLPPEPVPPEPPVLHGLRVLVVDDNAANRRILYEILQSWQMAPAVARGAREALELMLQARAEKNPFRLVLTDAHMPRVDGFMLTEQIKRDAGMGSTVVMMLTSGDRPDDTARCEELGIAAYLLKPIKQSELLEAIEMALGIALPPRLAPPAERRKHLRNLRILLAEDSLVNQKLAVALLEEEEHCVTVVGNGQEAIVVVAAQPFDLVLMDVQMPEMDGLEAAAEIRNAERNSGRHVPIVAMTAHALKGDREKCIEAGMDAYIAKPIRPDELFDTIDLVMAGRPAVTQSPAAPPAAAEPAAPTVPVAPAAIEPPVAPMAPAASAEEPPALDWDQALASVHGSRDALAAMIEAALEETPQRIEAIRRAGQRGDKTELRLNAHTLKSALRYFGAESAAEHAFALEMMGQQGQLGGFAPLFATLEAEVARFVEALRKSEGTTLTRPL